MSGRCFWKTSDTRWKIRSETELARRKPLCIKEFRPRSQKNEKILYFLKKSVDNVADSCYTINCSGSESAAPRSVGKIFIILQGAAETIGGIAQLGARAKRLHTPAPNSKKSNMHSLQSGGIAQLGERLNGIQEVSGSIPLISTTRKQKKLVLTKVKTSFFVFSLCRLIYPQIAIQHSPTPMGVPKGTPFFIPKRQEAEHELRLLLWR